MDKEIMELTRDMFKSGDMYRQLKRQPESKYKKKKKSLLKQNKQQCRALQNYEEPKREHDAPTMDEQNNSVIIWSISDNIFPKVLHKQRWTDSVEQCDDKNYKHIFSIFDNIFVHIFAYKDYFKI